MLAGADSHQLRQQAACPTLLPASTDRLPAAANNLPASIHNLHCPTSACAIPTDRLPASINGLPHLNHSLHHPNHSLGDSSQATRYRQQSACGR